MSRESKMCRRKRHVPLRKKTKAIFRTHIILHMLIHFVAV